MKGGLADYVRIVYSRCLDEYQVKGRYGVYFTGSFEECDTWMLDNVWCIES